MSFKVKKDPIISLSVNVCIDVCMYVSGGFVGVDYFFVSPDVRLKPLSVEILYSEIQI